MFVQHRERHRTDRIGWLRAAVLGANDGIVSTASLVVGVAAAHSTASDILVAGVAGLVAGAMSMAAGEYVPVSSQSDTERADLDRERKELATEDELERNELAAIYARRGVEPSLARQVADQLMAHDALAAHARDELGISDLTDRQPRSGGIRLCGNLCNRCRDAAGDRAGHAAHGIDPRRHRHIDPLSRAAGRVWCSRGRCPSHESRLPSHFLGIARDGTDGGRGRIIWSGRLMQGG